MVVAPHHLAAQGGLSVLRQGGNAVEAMIAAAATISVVYPHMNSVGGDGFWLIRVPGHKPIAVQGAGPAAANLSLRRYVSDSKQTASGTPRIRPRGGAAAITVAGTVASWQAALDVVRDSRARGALSERSELPLRLLLEDAQRHARNGFCVTGSQSEMTEAHLHELMGEQGFAQTFLADGGTVPSEGDALRQPRLAAVFESLERNGLDSFYRGDVGRSIAGDLATVGSPLRLEDLATFQATVNAPLSLRTSRGVAWNTRPPSQGVSSLGILGIYDRLEKIAQPDSFEHVHGIVEATKDVFSQRDAELTDPAQMKVSAESMLSQERLRAAAERIRVGRASEQALTDPGDTVYLAAVDSEGLAVSFIQSVYWEFGSGVVLPETGVMWQNRGVSFSLDPKDVNVLAPGKLPRHTLNPAMFETNEGDTIVYGTMGGDGQPQTQAALITRVTWFGSPLHQAVNAPRWLYGRTWGNESNTLKLEGGFNEAVAEELRQVGHDVRIVPRFSSQFGHAAMLRRRADGILEGAADPRADGLVAAY